MQVKKITAKIRDMVKVNLMENGMERAWYNNIEMPEEIKTLEMKDFAFNILPDGKIEFDIQFAPGVLPQVFPLKKARNHRSAKAMVSATPTAPTQTLAMAPQTKAIAPAPAPSGKPMAPVPAPMATTKDDAKQITTIAKQDDKPAVPTKKVDTPKVNAKPTSAARKSAAKTDTIADVKAPSKKAN